MSQTGNNTEYQYLSGVMLRNFDQDTLQQQQEQQQEPLYYHRTASCVEPMPPLTGELFSSRWQQSDLWKNMDNDQRIPSRTSSANSMQAKIVRNALEKAWCQ